MARLDCMCMIVQRKGTASIYMHSPTDKAHGGMAAAHWIPTYRVNVECVRAATWDTETWRLITACPVNVNSTPKHGPGSRSEHTWDDTYLILGDKSTNLQFSGLLAIELPVSPVVDLCGGRVLSL